MLKTLVFSAHGATFGWGQMQLKSADRIGAELLSNDFFMCRWADSPLLSRVWGMTSYGVISIFCTTRHIKAAGEIAKKMQDSARSSI